MSARFVIDTFDFVRNAGEHYGKIPLVELDRLRDYLSNNDGELAYNINGILDEDRRPALHIAVKGNLHLRCQRCLGKLVHILDLQTKLLLVNNEVELDQYYEDDSVDAILATPSIDVWHLIEDEIILGLPVSSRHRENECEIRNQVENNKANKKQSEHPFAALAALRKTH